jgi:ABC-type lipoprotein export system ATPase subunit
VNNGGHEHHKIIGIELTGGFLGDVRLDFVDGLNCIIGGRGTGKTTVLEFIRYALGLVPDPRVDRTRATAIEDLVEHNLGNGRIRLTIETKHGMRYVAERPFGETTQVLNAEGEATPITLDRELIFTADILSRNEIEDIAQNPGAQLGLIDKFVAEEARAVAAEIHKVERALEQSGADLLQMDRRLGDLAEVSSEATALEEKLRGLQQAAGPDGARINDAHAKKTLRDRERGAVEAVVAAVRRTVGEFVATASAAASRVQAQVDGDVLAGPNREVMAEVLALSREAAEVFEGAARAAADRCTSIEARLGEQRTALDARHAKQEKAYRDLIARTDVAKERAAERTQVERRYVEVSAAKKELEAQHKERRAAETQRRKLIAQLSDLRDRRFELRKGVAERLTEALGPTVQVSITQAGERIRYREYLTDALRGSGMKYGVVVDRIVRSMPPGDLVAAVQRSATRRLADRVGIDEDRAARVVHALRDTEHLYRLETVELEDLPRIALRDGRDYKESAQLSTGQRCTTILPILLLESERPLLIDQPEDNLDNEFVYETVVRSVREAKPGRQLIFVTHNPNIPVLGDAERVFVMCSDGDRGSVSQAGTVDEVKERIETLLEGGREAFRLRAERYGR